MKSGLNVGSGEEISIKNLVKKIAKFTSYNGEISWDLTKQDGTPRKLLNSERIKTLGWKPEITLDEGIKSTLELFIQSYKAGKIREK